MTSSEPSSSSGLYGRHDFTLFAQPQYPALRPYSGWHTRTADRIAGSCTSNYEASEKPQVNSATKWNGGNDGDAVRLFSIPDHGSLSGKLSAEPGAVELDAILKEIASENRLAQ